MDPDIPFSRPHVTGRESELVAEVLRSRQWSGDGEMTRRATRLLAARTGAGTALLTTSCTHALELAALLLDLGPDDEVIVPAFTFVTTASAFALRGAKIVFVDIRPDTLGLDERLVPAAVTSRTRAIVPVHYAGVACAMEAISEIAAAAGASVVEDNAHGLFGTWRGRPLGSLGRLATQSFHDTKNITCGEGGALIVNDPALVERAEIIREKGTNRARFFRGEIDKYTWVDLGSSYLPSELLAAVLVAQLEAADTIQLRRQRIWAGYATGLASWAERHGVTLPTVPGDCMHPAHLFYLRMPDLGRRIALLAHLRARGIHAVFHYQPLHLSELARRWGGRPGDHPVTEHVAETLIRLPLFPDLDDREQARIVDAVTSFIP
jgi:dTDP-4-amino-4,6-dideoxygalactose transaminase